eukprot:gene335-359_t
MSIIGLDFGSHSASIAVWYEDKGFWEVLADDLGFRAIPCAVAFRGEENVVGHSAITQQHKNTHNTFVGVRNLLLKEDKSHVHVPLLERDLTVQEINTLFFRNIHNQVKQQVGKAIREAVITTPQVLDEATKQRYIEAAQHGGIRIKSFLDDASAALLAYGLDDASLAPSKTLVVDLGWSRCTVSLFSISGGLFVPLASQATENICGSIMVKQLSEFCAKEFARKHKVPCQDNHRAMIRLSRECENAIRTLSTGAEATIDIDSLCEGIDYSTKISRARFEDLMSIPLIHFKNTITAVLTAAQVGAEAVTNICLCGGPSSVPRIQALLKAQFTNAVFPKVRFETYEVQCVGAVLHGKHLIEQGLLDNVPHDSPKASSLQRAVVLSSTASDATLEVVPAQSALPVKVQVPLQLSGSAGFLQLALAPAVAADPALVLGELVVNLPENNSDSPVDLLLDLSIAVSGELTANVSVASNKEVLSSLQVASA